MRLDPQIIDHSEPIRTCVGCGLRDLRDVLIRVVVDDGKLCVDLARVMPGRGAWVHCAPVCVAQAKKRRAFPRMLKCGMDIGNDDVHQPFWEELANVALSEAHRVPERE